MLYAPLGNTAPGSLPQGTVPSTNPMTEIPVTSNNAAPPWSAFTKLPAAGHSSTVNLPSQHFLTSHQPSPCTYTWRPPPGAAPQQPASHGVRYSTCLKIQALTLIAEGFPMDYIERRTGIAQKTLYRIRQVAAKRGFDPAIDPRVVEAFVVDGKRPGRPRKVRDGGSVGKSEEADLGVEAGDSEEEGERTKSGTKSEI